MNVVLPEVLSKAIQQSSEEDKRLIGEQIIHWAETYESVKAEKGEQLAIAFMYHEIDKAIEMHLTRSTRAVSCKKGCSICCEQYVSVSKDEATVLLAKLTESQTWIDFKKAKSQSNHDTDSWVKQDKETRTCMFLKDNACSIYEQRPAACRTYFVYSDPKLCDPANPDSVTVECPPMLAATTKQAGLWTAQNREGIFQTGLLQTGSLQIGSLPQMLLRARKEARDGN